MSNATPTLLYIDDDEALARLVDRGLTRLGLKVEHAHKAASMWSRSTNTCPGSTGWRRWSSC